MKKILVAVDENPTSKRAVEQAVKLAQAMEASLYLIHVVEPLPTYARQAESYLKQGELEHAMNVYGSEVLAPLNALIPEEVTHEAHLRPTSHRVSKEIVATAEEQGVDLIVLGRYGQHEGMSAAIFGRVAERVSRHARVPVMLVP